MKGEAGRAWCGARVGGAARVAVEAARDLAQAFEEGSAHFVPEMLTQVLNFSKARCGVIALVIQ